MHSLLSAIPTAFLLLSSSSSRCGNKVASPSKQERSLSCPFIIGPSSSSFSSSSSSSLCLSSTENAAAATEINDQTSSTLNDDNVPDETTNPEQKYNNLLEWLQSQPDAFVNDKVTIRYSTRGGGYGAFCSDDVDENELLFTVPRAACVTLQDAINDPDVGSTFKAVIDKAGPGGNTVVLAGFLAKEWLQTLEDDKGNVQSDMTTSSSGGGGTGGGGSRFGPYLRTLPWARFVNSQEHVLYWSEEDIETQLRGSMCYSESTSLRDEVKLATKVMNGIIGKVIREYRGENIDTGGFKWPWEVTIDTGKEKEMLEGLPQAMTGAFVSILTRAFQDGEGDDEKLVPLLDMLQHSDEPNISHAMRQDNGMVEVRARRPLQAGEELLNQYRSESEETMPYHRFFSRYGFVPGIEEPIQNLLADKSSIFFARKEEI